MRCRQIMNIGENLKTFNFDLAQTLIHRIRGRVVGGCVVVCGAGGGIDRHRSQAVAKRVHPRTRFAFLTTGAAAFGAIALICCDLPLDPMGPTFATPSRRRRAQREARQSFRRRLELGNKIGYDLRIGDAVLTITGSHAAVRKNGQCLSGRPWARMPRQSRIGIARSGSFANLHRAGEILILPCA